MENYQSYTAEDFVQDARFQSWVLSPTPELEQFWLDFQRSNPERRSVLVAARSLLTALHESQHFPTEEQGLRIWETISRETERPYVMEETEPERPVLPLWKWLSAAAMVLVALGMGWYYLLNSQEEATYTAQVARSENPLIEKVNSSAQPFNLTLSDGSRVVLYPGSRISYAQPFVGNKRDVYLSGKGFFEVVKDDTKPFVVFANQLVTQVVGTSFLIDAFASNASPSVEVRSGKVKVFRLDKYREVEQGKPEEMVLLTANQLVQYNVAKKGFDTRYVAKPELLKAPTAHPDFRFDNTDVGEAFQTLEEAYGVTIEYDQEALKNCHITVPLGNEPFFRKLDVICQTIGATYEVWGTRIVISGKGCGL